MWHIHCVRLRCARGCVTKGDVFVTHHICAHTGSIARWRQFAGACAALGHIRCRVQPTALINQPFIICDVRIYDEISQRSVFPFHMVTQPMVCEGSYGHTLCVLCSIEFATHTSVHMVHIRHIMYPQVTYGSIMHVCVLLVSPRVRHMPHPV